MSYNKNFVIRTPISDEVLKQMSQFADTPIVYDENNYIRNRVTVIESWVHEMEKLTELYEPIDGWVYIPKDMKYWCFPVYLRNRVGKLYEYAKLGRRQYTAVDRAHTRLYHNHHN